MVRRMKPAVKRIEAHGYRPVTRHDLYLLHCILAMGGLQRKGMMDASLHVLPGMDRPRQGEQNRKCYRGTLVGRVDPDASWLW